MKTEVEEYIEKSHRKIDDLENRINERISKVESNVIDKVTSQFMQTVDCEHNSQIRFQCEFEKKYMEFEHEVKTYLDALDYTVKTLDEKITPKWHSLLIITVSIISFSTIIVLLLTKL